MPKAFSDAAQDRMSTIRRVRVIAVSIIGAVGLASVVWTGIIEGLIRSQGLDYCLYVALLLSMVFLGGMWILTSDNELRIFDEWFHPESLKRPGDHSETVLIIIIAVSIAVLILSARHPRLLLSVYILYLLIDLYSWHYRRNEVRRAIEATQRLIEEENAREREYWCTALDKIGHYYLERPHLTRVSCMIVACVITAITTYTNRSANALWVDRVVYSGMLVTLVSGEILIFSWRHELSCFLRNIVEERREKKGP